MRYDSRSAENQLEASKEHGILLSKDDLSFESNSERVTPKHSGEKAFENLHALFMDISDHIPGALCGKKFKTYE